MMASISGPAFWVFVSDDPQWVRSNLVPRLLQRKIISEHVVADWNNGPRAFEDLLMCAARDHIISNSTLLGGVLG